LNQILPDPAAKGSIGLHSLPRLVSEAVDESAFLVFDLVGGNARSKHERDARGFIHPKLHDIEEAVGLVGRKER
jgi:hypothetical protein